jgi:hypothetical protein
MVTPSGGQSIDFYLITTGLPIDPLEGTLSKYYYDIIVGAIGLQADILLENVVRTVPNVDVTAYLPGYTQTPRNAYQFLIGVAGYSDPFTRKTLIQAIQTYALSEAEPNLVGHDKPKPNDYCFDPIATLDVDSSFKIYRGIGGQWLTQNFRAFYSDKKPTTNDGYIGSIWLVNVHGQIQFYYKDEIKGWGLLSDSGNVTISLATPTEVDGNWWILPSDFIFKQFNGTTWGSSIAYTFSLTAPVSGYWLYPVNSNTLEVRNLINSIWTPIHLSPFVVKLQSDNSNFLNEYTAPSAYNYTIDIEPSALYGGPITSGSPTVMATTYNEAIATGGANELFVNFFSHIPIADSAEVFVNGEDQAPEGFIISGLNLQFIDSVNGFTLNAGDLIVVYYQYSV